MNWIRDDIINLMAIFDEHGNDLTHLEDGGLTHLVSIWGANYDDNPRVDGQKKIPELDFDRTESVCGFKKILPQFFVIRHGVIVANPRFTGR